MIFGLKFRDPQKDIIALLKSELSKDIGVSSFLPPSGSKQKDSQIVVQKLGFSPLDDRILREYTFRIIIRCKNIEKQEFESFCQEVEEILGAKQISQHSKYFEVEGFYDESPSETLSSFTRVFSGSVLCQAY